MQQEGEEEDDDEPAAAGAQQKQQRSGVTLQMAEGWCAAAREKASMGAVRSIIKVGGRGRQPSGEGGAPALPCSGCLLALPPLLRSHSAAYSSLPPFPAFLSIQAYRAACHYGDSEEQIEESMRIASSAVYNKLMLFVLVRDWSLWWSGVERRAECGHA